jgi:general nucleoside transport system ATP-binding protein
LPVLQLHQITKRFNALLANDQISLSLNEGEILGLLGENGAGKTTLMNILFGHYTADSGSIELFGQSVQISSPRAAIAAGIGMVHQHFTLADHLSVLDNVILGTEPLWRPWQNRRAAKQRLSQISEQFGLTVNPDAQVADLSVGERQRVEILKALYRQVKILILDEPTAVLTPQETDALFATLHQMTEAGLSIVLISHKLQEVMRVSQRVVVLRAGQVVANVETAQTTAAQLAEQMVGRPIAKLQPQPLTVGAMVLELDRVTVTHPSLGSDATPLLNQINLSLRESEIVGIAGVSGNGQAALFDLVSGLIAPSQGSLHLYGQPVRDPNPSALVAAGVARIPEDRHKTGLIGDLSLWENLILEHHNQPAFSRFGLLNRPAARHHAETLIEAFDVRCPSAQVPVRLLSGGNMQKLILGRVLSQQPRLIIASQPTRGLDLGAVIYVHQQLLAARSRGAGILLISEDLEELLSLCDRLYVLYQGKLSDSLPIEQVKVAELGLLMAGKMMTGESL